MNRMEECGALVGDCAVVCCCCPCLLVQLTVCFVLWLPKRVKRMAAGRRRRGSERGEAAAERDRDVQLVLEGKSLWLEEEEAWEELLGRGLFWFGSFWGGDDGSHDHESSLHRIGSDCCIFRIENLIDMNG